jgi:hypothetical protein
MLKNIGIIAAVIACLLAALISAQRKSADAVRPPAGATNLLAFLEVRPLTNQIRRFVFNGKAYLEVIGKVHLSTLAPRSGPPVYIFDETGAFVDWCGDIGDNNVFVKKWGGFSNATNVSVDEAKQLLKVLPQ